MELVIRNPRPYDVVMMYSVKRNCPYCEIVLNEYNQMVYSFIKERGINKNFMKEKKIFFGILLFKED
jgi:hypothetical protein